MLLSSFWWYLVIITTVMRLHPLHASNGHNLRRFGGICLNKLIVWSTCCIIMIIMMIIMVTIMIIILIVLISMVIIAIMTQQVTRSGAMSISSTICILHLFIEWSHQARNAWNYFSVQTDFKPSTRNLTSSHLSPWSIHFANESDCLQLGGKITYKKIISINDS